MSVSLYQMQGKKASNGRLKSWTYATRDFTGAGAGESVSDVVVSGGGLFVPDLFNGDFAALAATYSLTVKGFWRGDIGVSGTQGTGFATLANQSGTSSGISGVGTNGLTSTTGISGHAGFSSDGSTQLGLYTKAAQGAPVTTNIHKWWIGRQLVVPSAGAYLYTDAASVMAGILTASSSEIQQYGSGAGATTSGVVNNQWYRGRVSYTGSSSDQIRIGAHAPAPTITSNFSSGVTSCALFGSTGGGQKLSYEMLSLLDLEGTLANFLLFDADASTKSRVWFSTAIEI